MSEPESKLDLHSLNDALEVSATAGDPTKVKTAEEGARELMDQSNTLKESEGRDSPQTLSPPRSPEPTARAEPVVQDNDAALDPTTRQIKSMFPDLEADTIQAVVVAEDGDFERAINTLLQMSDPTYVPPPPFRPSRQTKQDEQLARSLVEAEGEDARRQFVAPSGRAAGGGLGSFFGLSGQGEASERNEQSYNTSNLTYQPRVRRTPSGQTTPLRQTLTEDPGHPQSFARSQNSSVGGVTLPPALPGPKEAKQWQEDINKLAETGFAKAASTFSALRQRGEQAWANRPQNGSPSGQAGDASGQRGGSFFAGRNQRNAGSGSIVSPTIGSDRGFDRDPSPVGDNELAKILARGRDGADDRQRSAGKSNIADRYKNVIATQRSNMKAKQTGSTSSHGDVDDDAAFSWDDAGRTSSKSKAKDELDVAQSFQPIKIADNSGRSTPNEGQKTGQRNTVSLLDNSADKKPVDSTHQQLHAQDDDDDDDLEYVANPFEDED